MNCRNVFSILQQIGYKDKRFIEGLKIKLSSDDLVLAEQFLNDEPIPLLYVALNGNNPRRNVHIDEFKICDFELYKIQR